MNWRKPKVEKKFWRFWNSKNGRRIIETIFSGKQNNADENSYFVFTKKAATNILTVSQKKKQNEIENEAFFKK